MSDEQAYEIYDQMKKVYGDKLPNPIHFPNSFEYYLKLFKYSDKPSL